MSASRARAHVAGLLLRTAASRSGLALSLVGALACSDAGASAANSLRWSVIESGLPGALVSVWGRAADDVWIVGGDRGNGQGPTVLRFAGDRISTLTTGETSGDLWWVTSVADASAEAAVYMGGKDGLILRYVDDAFERMVTPGSGTVFGLWAAASDDVWAVGGVGSTGAFAWRLRDHEWLPAEGFPSELAGEVGLRKVWGTSARDVWFVGTRGTTVHYDGDTFEVIAAPKPSELFTVHARGERVAAVGGVGSGVILEWDRGGWVDLTPANAPELTGVWLEGDLDGYAVGAVGAVFERSDQGWTAVDTGALVDEDLHSVWSDGAGCVLAAGGRWRAYPLTRGVLLRGCR